MFTGLRPSYELSDTILDSSTHALQEKLWFVRFRSLYQKWGGEEECEFSGLLDQISNFLTFFNHRAKRGGSLFQGGSGEEEGSRSDPQVAVGYPSVRRFFIHKLS